jgi:hypothetical protein
VTGETTNPVAATRERESQPEPRPSTKTNQDAEHTTAERRQKAMDTRAERHLREIEKQWHQYQD